MANSEKHFNRSASSEEFAFLAGIIESRGTFLIYKTHANKKGIMRHRALLLISSTKKELIEHIKIIFNGDSQKTNESFCRVATVYTWRVGGKRLDLIIDSVYKYLITKKKHCDYIIDLKKTFNKDGSTKPISLEKMQQREDIVMEYGKYIDEEKKRIRNTP